MHEEDFVTYLSACRDHMFDQNICFGQMPACYSLFPTLFFECFASLFFFFSSYNMLGWEMLGEYGFCKSINFGAVLMPMHLTELCNSKHNIQSFFPQFI